ncbi:hypothetical protein ACH5RR_015074 [Cinchona calisaya]|uniref:Uncharacterized protein n=1 Tax=Cinchona calisaya TaxID=153742 RepID=A0ABD2ZVK0_9GENT
MTVSETEMVTARGHRRQQQSLPLTVIFSTSDNIPTSELLELPIINGGFLPEAVDHMEFPELSAWRLKTYFNVSYAMNGVHE